MLYIVRNMDEERVLAYQDILLRRCDTKTLNDKTWLNDQVERSNVDRREVHLTFLEMRFLSQ